MIRFLHLSDIHFRESRAGGHYDLDADLRNELEVAAEALVQTVGELDAILVCGDIAFSGSPSEYEAAGDWLVSLCERLGATPEIIRVVPGNHDVDRGRIDSSRVLQLLHQDLRPIDAADVDDRLEQALRDPAGADLLYEPIQAFSSFASRFGCDLAPARPWWEDDFPLDDGSVLRVRGVNSTLVSDSLDNDGEHRLILGTGAASVPREAEVAWGVMCHHPPQWLKDQDAVEDLFTSRTALQMYGHKHRQRLFRVNDSLKLVAGAVHPSRRESGWEPRFNIVTVRVEEAAVRELVVGVWPMAWRDSATAYVPDHDENGEHERTFALPFPAQPRRERAEVEAPAHATIPLHNTVSVPVEVGVVNDYGRWLAYRFLTLAYHQRIQIAQTLDLLEDEDQGARDAELFRRLFQRAHDRNVLGSLWDAVESAHADEHVRENPFRRNEGNG